MSGSVKLTRLEDKMNSQRQQGGSQKDWDEVRKCSNLPIITIITSTYNVVQDLQWTIDSIRNQTYPNIQWIIADGASTDGTVGMLEANSELVDYWFSEPDTGIYDAWNKALEHVKGDWVQFMGAGDELYETNTLEKVAPYLKNAYPKYELVYGQVMHISEKGRKELYVSGEPWKHYQGKWEGNRPKLPVQTGIYHRFSLFDDRSKSFDTSYQIVADCHFLLEKNNCDKEMAFIPFTITKMPMGGISGSIRGGLRMYLETNRSVKELGIIVPINERLKNTMRFYFTKSCITVMSFKRYEKFIDFTKAIRGKPILFTID